MNLGLVQCTKTKMQFKCKASEMYTASALFRATFAYAINTYDTVAILSAKYGLLLPDDEIEPYEVTLNALNVQARKQWAKLVLSQMQERLDFHGIRQVFFHAGKAYRENLSALLTANNIECIAPLAKLRIGEQLHWYKSNVSRFNQIPGKDTG